MILQKHFRSKLPLRACVLLAAALLSATQDAGSPGTVIPDLNLKVVKFAENHKGKQVGNGECWTLAADALSHAGAQRPGADGVDVFDFGRKLKTTETILPGDIIQFEKAAFVHKDKSHPSSISFPQHTAIASKVEGKRITMLHQNFAGTKTVGSATINLDERTAGTVDFFRPRPARPPSANR